MQFILSLSLQFCCPSTETSGFLLAVQRLPGSDQLWPMQQCCFATGSQKFGKLLLHLHEPSSPGFPVSQAHGMDDSLLHSCFTGNMLDHVGAQFLVVSCDRGPVGVVQRPVDDLRSWLQWSNLMHVFYIIQSRFLQFPHFCQVLACSQCCPLAKFIQPAPFCHAAATKHTLFPIPASVSKPHFIQFKFQY